MPRGACLTWPAGYAYGYNGSYRRGLPQPIDRPSACVLKVWWAVARMHSISLQTVNSPYLCPTRWGHYIRITPGCFLLPSSLFGGEKRSLTMQWLIYQGSTLAVSVRKQGQEELRKWKPKTGEAHFPCPMVTLCKAVVGDLRTPLAQAAVSVQNPPSGSQTCFPGGWVR